MYIYVCVLEKLFNFFQRKIEVFLECKAEFIPNKMKTPPQKCLVFAFGLKHCFCKLPSYQNYLESILKVNIAGFNRSCSIEYKAG